MGARPGRRCRHRRARFLPGLDRQRHSRARRRVSQQRLELGRCTAGPRKPRGTVRVEWILAAEPPELARRACCCKSARRLANMDDSPVEVLLEAADLRPPLAIHRLLADLLDPGQRDDRMIQDRLLQYLQQHSVVEVLRLLLDAIFLGQRMMLEELEHAKRAGAANLQRGRTGGLPCDQSTASRRAGKNDRRAARSQTAARSVRQCWPPRHWDLGSSRRQVRRAHRQAACHPRQDGRVIYESLLAETHMVPAHRHG